MAGSQFKERVLVPLAVIAATVFGLAFLGKQLLGLSGATDSAAMPSSSPTTIVLSQTPTPTPTVSVTPTVARIPVIVLNGTTKAGYAKQIGDALTLENWVISSVGNWDGDKFETNMVFYPAGYEEAANLLAASTNVMGIVVPAEGDFDQTALTVVLAK